MVMERNGEPEEQASCSKSPSLSESLDSQESDKDASTDQSEDELEMTARQMNSKLKGDSFCDCHKKGLEKSCKCGEEDTYFEWIWDDETKSAASYVKDDMREVMFHIDYSCGTAAVRGTLPLKNDQYYWEIKMTTPVYGTDMMVGVCTAHIDLNKCRHMFCSMIGQDTESWGLSYTGMIQHRSIKGQYSSKFGQGSIIGIHLDMWHGTLSFYKNKRPLGVAYTGLHGKILYPIVSSTAARSGMKVIRSCSFPTSLQFMCCQVLRKVIPNHLDVLKVINLPPGFKNFLENNVSWLLQPCPSQMPPRDKGLKRKLRKRTNDGSFQADDSAGPSNCKQLLLK